MSLCQGFPCKYELKEISQIFRQNAKFNLNVRPLDEDMHLLKSDPEKIRAQHYDLGLDFVF